MSFLIFLLYYIICTIILGIIGVLVYKFYLKGKFFNISKFTEKQIDDYFNAYDDMFNNAFNDDNIKESEKDKNDKKIYSSF